MSSRAPAGSAPELLAEVSRGELIESRHRGHLVGLDPTGAVAFSVGDPDTLIYPRSSLKPIQAVAMLRHGAELTDERLALAAASHSGEPDHVALVLAVLSAAGLSEEALACPPALPLSGDRSLPPSRLLMNCSGKHAGMLTACVAAGDPIEGYTDPAHPLQRQVAATFADLAGGPVGPVAVDGCGAPVFGSALVGLARSFQRLVLAVDGPEHATAQAMRAHPWLVGGTGRDVTRLMQRVPGLIAKDGAEGVYAAALPDGSAVALKVEDGGDRARPPVLCQALGLLGADLSKVEARLLAPPVLGGGRPVGAVRAAF